MDISAALTVISQAIGLAKDLRDIDNNLDTATHKAKMAELYGSLADVKMALTDARSELHDKNAEIEKLHQTIATLKTGETCPICGIGNLKVTSSSAHPHFGTFGLQERILKCDNENCSHSEKRRFDPEDRKNTKR